MVLPVSLFENFEVGAHETGTALHIGEFPESQMFHKPRGKCGVYTKHLRFWVEKFKIFEFMLLFGELEGTNIRAGIYFLIQICSEHEKLHKKAWGKK